MKYSEQVATATGEYRDSLPATLFDHKLKVLTVELQGGMFHGSGVLYQVTGDLVWVLTAAHNLHVWAEDEMQSKHEDLADDFIEEVKVRILPRHKAARDYPIESIKLHDGNAKCGYDVCAVSIRSDALAGDVRQLLENNTGGPFRLGDTDGDATSTLLLKADVSDWVASQNQLGNYAIVQFGYGKDGSDKYHRHWRALKWQDLKNAATKPAYLQSAKETGAAVAARILPLAAGSDGAGSIRIPSALCGLVGLKTTRGLVPNPHSTFERIGISGIGPMARSAPDAAALLDVLLGHRGHGPTLAGIDRTPKAQKVAVSLQSSIIPTHPDAERAVRRVADVLAALGHTIDEGPVVDGTVSEFLPIYQHIIARTPVLNPAVLESTTTWLRQTGKGISYDQAVAARDAIACKVHSLLAPWDLWLTPAVAIPTPKVAEAGNLEGQARFDRLAELGIWTAPLNASGNPAVSIPVVVDGMPWGVQLAGRLGSDATLLAFAHAIMQALGTPIAPAPPRYAPR